MKVLEEEVFFSENMFAGEVLGGNYAVHIAKVPIFVRS